LPQGRERFSLIEPNDRQRGEIARPNPCQVPQCQRGFLVLPGKSNLRHKHVRLSALGMPVEICGELAFRFVKALSLEKGLQSAECRRVAVSRRAENRNARND
jgi:hypothetical protein